MRTLKRYFILTVLSIFISAGLQSCAVHFRHSHVPVKKGWLKNSNNPHHPHTTNPGHTKHKKHKKNK